MRKKDRNPPGSPPARGRRGRSRSERDDNRKAFREHPRGEGERTPFRPKRGAAKPFRDRDEGAPSFSPHRPRPAGTAPAARVRAEPDERARRPWREHETDATDRPLRPDKPPAPRHSRGEGRRERPRFAKKPWQMRRDPDGPALLYGWHTVKAALANPARKIRRLLASESAARRLADEMAEIGIEPEIVDAAEITALTGPEAVHQGLLAEADPLDTPAIEDLDAGGLVLVLDQITDPHNVGAMLRSSAAFAVAAIVTTERHSPEATGVLAKAASGALEYVPVVTVVNLARGLEALKDKGFMIVGLDSAGDVALAEAPLRAPLALVLGAEGKGLRHLTRQNCDVLARLDLPGRIKSLNVSNATALALHIAHSKLGDRTLAT
jgi:23S rRNA (guanosine2251-2'-O)-methyltransferase